MTQRFYAAAGRIIFSKPGYDATASLPDTFKIFDSDWVSGNVLIASGSIVGSTTISFPQQHFVPLVETRGFDNRLGLDWVNYDFTYSVTTNSLTITFTSGDINRVDYAVYGIAL